MSDPQWKEIERIVNLALELEGEEVEAFLREECGADEALRERVQRILESYRDCEPMFLMPTEVSSKASRRMPGDETELPESQVLGKYRIVRRVGEGGMATVYLAVHGDLKNEVALKVLPRFATGSEERVSRFKREAITVANLRHPGIVAVHDIGEEDGVHFIAMDYVDGPTLARFLYEARVQAGDRRMEVVSKRDYVRQQCDWVAQIAEALHHAHQKGIVHRDVKPSNILLHEGNSPLLTDFGVAKNLLEPSDTATGQMAGTAPYMSPEQARAAKNTIDPRSDIFSLGTVLYEALTLRQPFRGETLEDSLKNVLFHHPAKINQLNPGVPRDLVTICHKAIEKDPLHRYSTAAHMAGDLRCFLEGSPILASPPSIWRRGRELIKRHRVAFLLAVVGLLSTSLVLLLFVSNSLKNQGKGQVAIDAGVAGLDVFVQYLDQDSRKFIGRTHIGKTPLTHYLEPGHYRFTVVNSTGDFREASSIVVSDAEDALVLDFTTREREHGMILIPGGTTDQGVELGAFFIDRREVSNSEYREFVQATGYPEPDWWRRFGFPEDVQEHPVVGVSWFDCRAYASWKGLRLPTSVEWEFAMTRPDGRLQPWEDQEFAPYNRPSAEEIVGFSTAGIEANLALYRQYTAPTGEDLYASTLGILHGASNAAEITDTTVNSGALIIKGASWLHDPREFHLKLDRHAPLWTESSDGIAQPAWSIKNGFRCARSAAIH